jgi:peptidoglycan/xylan/chitin deacetylase (PgdA/CDA1 family)
MNDAHLAKGAGHDTPETLPSHRAGGNETVRWQPAPAIRCSAALHVAGAMTLAAHLSWWPWIAGALAANHLMVFSAVLRPRSRLLGPNLTRLPACAVRRQEICLTFDDGPDPELTPRVLDLLDRHDAKASFFCIGERVAAFPAVVKDIARRGHSIENHSFRHSHAFAVYSVSRLEREVALAQEVIADVAGQRPRFFRAPAGFRSPLLDAVLAHHALRYVSWTRRGYDTVRRDPRPALRQLTRGLVAGDVLLLHDGAPVRTCAGEPVVLPVLAALLEQLAARGLKSVALPAACNDEPAREPELAAACH